MFFRQLSVVDFIEIEFNLFMNSTALISISNQVYIRTDRHDSFNFKKTNVSYFSKDD